MKYQAGLAGTLVGAVFMSISLTTLAETQMYVSGGLGYIQSSDVEDLFQAGNFVTLTSVGEVKDTSDGYSAALGVRLPWNLAMELAYFDLGDYKYTSKEINLNTNTYDQGKQTITFEGPAFALRGDWPIGDSYGLYSKIGIMKFRAKRSDRVDVVDISSGVLINSNSDSRTISDESMFFTVGGEYHATEATSVYLEYNLVMGEYSDVLVSADSELNGLFVGMRYSFGKTRGDSNKGVHARDGRKRAVTACDPDFQDVVGGTACQ